MLPSLPVGCMFPFGSGASIGPPGSSLVPTNSGNIGSTSCAIKPILVLVRSSFHLNETPLNCNTLANAPVKGSMFVFNLSSEVTPCEDVTDPASLNLVDFYLVLKQIFFVQAITRSDQYFFHQIYL